VGSTYPNTRYKSSSYYKTKFITIFGISQSFQQLAINGSIIKLCKIYLTSGNCPLAFNYKYESLFYETRVSFDEGGQIKEEEGHKKEFKKSTKKLE
jgi:hypothetical protein